MVDSARISKTFRLRRLLRAALAMAGIGAGAGPAWAGATTYDIAILLYQTHPWVGGRQPEGALRRARVPAGPDRWRVSAPPLGGSGAGMADSGGIGPAPAAGPTGKGGKPGPYSFFVYGGRASKEVLSRSLEFDTTNTNLAAAGLTARLYTFDFGLEIEGEIGLARRFGEDKLWEGWFAAGVRWRDFPWNDTIRTTVGAALLGLDYTTKVPPHEVAYHQNDGTRLLNFFSPEITLALPELPGVALMLRMHHRSPIFGLLDYGAATFYSVGLRFQL